MRTDPSIFSSIFWCQDVGKAAEAHWWEEKRNVTEVQKPGIDIQLASFRKPTPISTFTAIFVENPIPGANPSQLWLCHRASVLRPCSPTFWTVQHASKGSAEVREIGLLFFSFQTNVKPGQQRKYQYAWVHLVGLLASIARSTPTTQNFSKAFPLLPAMDSRSFLTNLFF